jgi:hypothetical protein
MCIQFVPLLISMLNCFSNGFQWFLQRSSPLLITTFFSSGFSALYSFNWEKTYLMELAQKNVSLGVWHYFCIEY